MVGPAKILNFANTFFAVLVWALSIVVLNQVNFHEFSISQSCMLYAKISVPATLGGTPNDYDVDFYQNLWGRCSVTPKNAGGGTSDKVATCDALTGDACNGVNSGGGDIGAIERKSCHAYQMQTTFYVLVSLAFAFATIKLIVSFVALCKPMPAVLGASILTSFFTWLWLLVFWTLYYTQAYFQGSLAPLFGASFPPPGLGGGDVKIGTGFGAAIAGCWLAFLAMLLSVGHFVAAGKEEGGGGLEMKNVGP